MIPCQIFTISEIRLSCTLEFEHRTPRRSWDNDIEVTYVTSDLTRSRGHMTVSVYLCLLRVRFTKSPDFIIESSHNWLPVQPKVNIVRPFSFGLKLSWDRFQGQITKLEHCTLSIIRYWCLLISTCVMLYSSSHHSWTLCHNVSREIWKWQCHFRFNWR